MTIYTYNARTLASEAVIKDLIQARKIKYDVIRLIETRRRHPLNAVYKTGEHLFLGTCDSRDADGVGVLVNTSMAKNVDSFEQLTPDGRLRMRRCGPTPALTIFVAYAPTSSYEEEVEAFYTDLEKFYRRDHAFYKVIIGDFNAKVGPRRTPEEFHIGAHGLQWNDQGERLSEFIMTTKTIHGNSQFQKPSSLRWMWKSPAELYRNEIDHIIVHLSAKLARLCREVIKEDLKKRRAEVLAEAAEADKSIRYVHRDFSNRKARMTALHNPKGTTIASRRAWKKSSSTSTLISSTAMSTSLLTIRRKTDILFQRSSPPKYDRLSFG
ncbi:hypothetical protein RB195_008934 [Necator americanus]